jgi:DNA-directed RNA polymerase subunit RPC12/RpoP
VFLLTGAPMIVVRCPQCKKASGVADSAAGALAACPYCQSRIQVPAKPPTPVGIPEDHLLPDEPLVPIAARRSEETRPAEHGTTARPAEEPRQAGRRSEDEDFEEEVDRSRRRRDRSRRRRRRYGPGPVLWTSARTQGTILIGLGGVLLLLAIVVGTLLPNVAGLASILGMLCFGIPAAAVVIWGIVNLMNG